MIDKAATGSDGVRHDWRAAETLLMFEDWSRFGRQTVDVNTSNVQVNMIAPDRLAMLTGLTRPTRWTTRAAPGGNRPPPTRSRR